MTALGRQPSAMAWRASLSCEMRPSWPKQELLDSSEAEKGDQAVLCREDAECRRLRGRTEGLGRRESTCLRKGGWQGGRSTLRVPVDRDR